MNYGTTIPVANIRLAPLLVTSETVPMQFFTEMKLSVSNVVPYDELEQHIARLDIEENDAVQNG